MQKTIGCLILMGLLVVGCGSKDDTTPQAPAPKPKKEKTEEAQPSTTDAAPPPAPVAPAAPSAPGAAAPAQAAPDTGGMPVNDGTDPLFFFRQGANGAALSDLEALQQAANAYSQRGAISEPDRPAWPSLKGGDISLLVKYGVIKRLPTAPEGQKYIIDQKSMKVALVNK